MSDAVTKNAGSSNDNSPQVDPLLFLMETTTDTIENDTALEGSLAGLEKLWSQGASDSSNAGTEVLKADAQKIHALSGDDNSNGKLIDAQTQYQLDQTTIQQNNQQMNAVAQGGGPQMQNLSTSQSNAVAFAKAVLAAWSSLQNSMAATG